MITDFLLNHFSYTVLFLWSILEGEIGLSLAGYLSKDGNFDFVTVISIAISGAVIGDTFLFLAGKLFKAKAVLFLQRYEKHLQRVEKWFRRNVVWLILFERFIYGTHIPALLLIGMSGYSFIKFLLLDIIGVTIWAFTFTSLGYYFGENVINIIVLLQRHLSVLFLVIVLMAVLFIQNRVEKKEDDS
jgi:membrane protein DedA with SNARE-associated domain